VEFGVGIYHKCSGGSVVSVATICRLDGVVSNPGRGKRPEILQNHQYRLWDRGVMLATQLILVLRLRISRATFSFFLYASCRGQEQLTSGMAMFFLAPVESNKNYHP
jgi:hypothetical protein